MIVIDANLLIYAYNSDDERYDAASRWLDATLSGSELIGLPWCVIHAFLRITTGTRALSRPLSVSSAFTIVNEWINAPKVRTLEPGSRYWPIFRTLLEGGSIRGNQVTDADIAALALENDAAVCTTDRDFDRFPGLRVINPLV